MSSTLSNSFEDPAEDAAVLLLRIGLALLAMAVPISMVLSRRALFILFPIGSGLLLVAGVLLYDAPIRKRLRNTFLSTAGLCGLGLIGWMAVSLIWSPVAPEVTQRLAKVAGTLVLVIVTAAFLPERTRTSNLNLFPLGIVVAGAITIYTALSGDEAWTVQGEDSTIQRAVVGLVVLVWPSLGALAIRERWVSASVIVIAVAVSAVVAWTSEALAALALGSVAFAVATANPARVGRGLGIAVAALFLLGPVLPFAAALLLKIAATVGGERVLDLAGDDAALRVWADLVVGQPLRLMTGHGFGLATLAPTIGFLPPETPHSLLFEVWYDFGVIGAALAAALAVFGFELIGRLSTTVAPFLLAEFVSLLTIAFCGLETTQLWWTTLLGVVALAFATVVRGQYRTVRPAARFEPPVEPTLQ